MNFGLPENDVTQKMMWCRSEEISIDVPREGGRLTIYQSVAWGLQNTAKRSTPDVQFVPKEDQTAFGAFKGIQGLAQAPN